MPETHEVHHHQLRLWLVALIAAFILLVVSGLAAQHPQSLTGVPFLGPEPTPTPIASNNISVSRPLANENIGQAFIVTGKARTFENQVSIRLREKLSGKILGETSTYTTAMQPGQFGDFNAGIELADTTMYSGTKLLLEVFQKSAKDGKEIDKVTIPITFSPTAD